MNSLVTVPVKTIMGLSAEQAVGLIRSILRAECQYARISPSALTISERLTVADGGIDSEINTPLAVPNDCLFQSGLTGFQLKAGDTFKPWQPNAIQKELGTTVDDLPAEVARLVGRTGRYVLVCTGHDLTPEQRNGAKALIADRFLALGHPDYAKLIDVLGANQIAEFAERYPPIAATLIPDAIQEALVLDEWRQAVHMSNQFEPEAAQAEVIAQIQAGLLGDVKHVRVLGEPGLGKTRMVLEAVSVPHLAGITLYFEHGSHFGQSRLFRHLLKTRCDKPMVVIIDELSESEMMPIWGQLKNRCGTLKLVTLDHGRDESRAPEILTLFAPKLGDNAIEAILAKVTGSTNDLTRWVAICEGSPRVAHAVAENLLANPDDLLRPPATVPLWDRFLYGYGKRDEQSARQMDCVALHLALFNRFGFEDPVTIEARYIASLVEKMDSTIGWARFQEIIRILRDRRVLQGTRTLFFVPRALHIYLWKKFWRLYGQSFQFAATFSTMPDTLHIWFMNMFKYADHNTASNVVGDILRSDGIYAAPGQLTSAKGSRFLSILAEANPQAVLKLLEVTIGRWPDEALLELVESRQNIVWTLEKIAVWTPTVVRALRILARLAVNENATNRNNATGVLVGLFMIGPEYVATEASPQERLPAGLAMLRSNVDAERLLGLQAIAAAAPMRTMRHRIVGPEYQGMQQRAKLWRPENMADWVVACRLYFQTLIDESDKWPTHLRPAICNTLLEVAGKHFTIPECSELALQVLARLVDDPAMDESKLNQFFDQWKRWKTTNASKHVNTQILAMARNQTRRSLANRFQRYVIDADWWEWRESPVEGQKRSRAKPLTAALANRLAKQPLLFNQIEHLLAPQQHVQGFCYFGQFLARADTAHTLLQPLLNLALAKKSFECLGWYLDEVYKQNRHLHFNTLQKLLIAEGDVWLGAALALRSEYDESLFCFCLDALEAGWIESQQFSTLKYARMLQAIPFVAMARLMAILMGQNGRTATEVLIDLLVELPFADEAPFEAQWVFETVTRAISHRIIQQNNRGYEWKHLCTNLIDWDEQYRLPLFDCLLNAMKNDWQLSCDHCVSPLAADLLKQNPQGAWQVLAKHFELTLPKTDFDLCFWLSGSNASFDETITRGPIADLPLDAILAWIEVEPENRAALVAHASPKSLDDEYGGQLLRELLTRYPVNKGVKRGINFAFCHDGWCGSESEYFKRKRDMFRNWLTKGYSTEVIQWIEEGLDNIDARITNAVISEERDYFD